MGRKMTKKVKPELKKNKLHDELVDYIIRHADKEELMKLSFNELEDYMVSFTQGLGNEFIQKIVDLKSSQTEAPNNIIKSDNGKKKL